MPSTRNQKAEVKRSRQSDVMFDLEKMGEMLGDYSRIELELNLDDRNVELDLLTGRVRQVVIQNNENFRSL